MIVLDTNVVSEVLKPSPSDVVLRWLSSQQSAEVFITTVTQAEVLYGVERLPAGKRRDRLSGAVEAIISEVFPGRILPFGEEAAAMFPMIAMQRERSGRPIATFDAMIAAICRSRRAAIATRDVSGFEQCGIRIINPWESDSY